jgi:valyl-tRNA synthetase
VPPSKPSPVLLRDASAEVLDRVGRWIDAVRRLARASDVLPLKGEMPKGSAQALLDETTVVLPLEGLIDVAAERVRLSKERDKAAGEARRTGQKLDNADFVARAREDVVAENRDRLAAALSEIARLQAALDRLDEM